ncbi:phenoloxidase-activating factor 2 isoform X3 [Rhipicephalus microplus]|nr:phenoloxidase-activating factor 2-like isoform X1 [Rhipicephalus microplus]
MWLLLTTLGAACLTAQAQQGDSLAGKFHVRLPPPQPLPPQKDLAYLGEDPSAYFGGDPKTGPEGGVPLGECVCVPYYQCKEGKVSEDGGGLLDARRKLPPKEEIPLDGLGDQNQQCPGVDQVCCAEPSAVTETPYVASCGIRNDNGINSRILTKDGKGEAEFGEWPWQAAVLKYESEILKFECGGTLIASRYVLTVAHCVARFNGADRVPLKVRLGEWDTQSMKEFYPHEDYDVGNIYIHQYFRNNSLWNDIALLELTRPVTFAPHISPICLPKLEDVFEGTSCVVTGWGKDAYRTGKFANIMKEVTVPVIDNPMCQNLLRQTRLGRYFRLHEGFICAGTEDGVDSCKGDGGGPLSCYTPDGRYHLAGLVAWGIDCGTPDVPGVYVRVAKYLDWISEVTRLPISEFYPK